MRYACRRVGYRRRPPTIIRWVVAPPTARHPPKQLDVSKSSRCPAWLKLQDSWGYLSPLPDARQEVTGIETTLRARLLPDACRIAVLVAALCGLALAIVLLAPTPASAAEASSASASERSSSDAVNDDSDSSDASSPDTEESDSDAAESASSESASESASAESASESASAETALSLIHI